MTPPKYPPLGKLVDVGGYRLHINCSGKGKPTVVFDSGLGGFMLDWWLVQPQIAQFARVCSYDRSCCGWSDPSPSETLRTSQYLAHELHTLLVNAAVEGPFVLVGHSFGGLNVRAFAGQYPDEVVGMVLLDAPHEDMEARLEGFSPDSITRMWTLLARLTRLGIVWRWLGPRLARMMVAELKKLPPDIQTMYLTVALDSQGVLAAAREAASFRDSATQLRAAPKLGDLPLIVLTPASSSPAWMELQKELAGLSTQGKYVVVEDTGHHIALGRPDIIVDAVRQVVEAVPHTQSG